MFTATFYSFRGGVGRTMAMANIAYNLAAEGLKVFLIDFDLEAPGLTLMPQFQPADEGGPKSTDGLLGFLRAGIENRRIPQVKDLAYEPLIASDEAVQKGNGRIHVLPAGDVRGSAKQYDLSRLRLSRLYADEQRSVVLDDLKAQIEQDFEADYLLVDSRTGWTEIGGVCTVHLADVVVVLFGLNVQNVEGTRLVLGKLCAGRPDLQDHFIFVASPVPLEEEGLKHDRMMEAKRVFSGAIGKNQHEALTILEIPYHPLLAVREEIFTRERPEHYLTHAYLSIASAIRSMNPADLEFDLYRRALQAPRRGTGKKGMSELRTPAPSPTPEPEPSNGIEVGVPARGSTEDPEEFYRRCLGVAPDHANSLANYALFLDEQGRSEEAEKLYRRCFEVARDHANNLANYALFLDKHGRSEEAEKLYRRCLAVAPDHANNLANYALFLDRQGRSDEAEKLYRRCLEVAPDHANNLANYALFLHNHARFEEAEDHYRGCLDVEPNHANNLANYALFLEQRGRLDEAEEMYRRCLDAAPDHANNLTNYALFLQRRRGLRQGRQSGRRAT